MSLSEKSVFGSKIIASKTHEFVLRGLYQKKSMNCVYYSNKALLKSGIFCFIEYMQTKRLKFRQTTIITIGLLAFLGGLGLARTGYSMSVGVVLVLAIFSLAVFRKKSIITVACIVLFGLTFGWWRGGNYLHLLAPYKQLDKQKVVLRVTAMSDGVYNKTQLSFDGGGIEVREPFKQKIPGRVIIKGYGESAIYRGDIIQAEGRLYLTRGSKQAGISFADIKALGREDSTIETVRLRFLAGMQNALPEPLASFGLGLLIGQRTTLPDTVTRDLAIVGLTHIIAVSGYNLTIIVRGVRRQLGKQSKYQSLVLSFALIGLFLLVTGFSASIVRAAIVSVLSLLAWYYGRTFRPILLLAIVAVLTAGWYPLYLWSDIGWYLSFLAFYGVLVLAPMIVKRLYGSREPSNLRLIIFESVCAQLMTAPFILFIFKQVSIVGLIGNVLVVPFVPLAMLLSLMAGLAGMLIPVLAGWVAWPARILLTYMLDLVNIMARWSHALLVRTLSLQSMLFLYGLIIFVSFVLWRKTLKTVRVTDVEIEEKVL